MPLVERVTITLSADFSRFAAATAAAAEAFDTLTRRILLRRLAIGLARLAAAESHSESHRPAVQGGDE